DRPARVRRRSGIGVFAAVVVSCAAGIAIGLNWSKVSDIVPWPPEAAQPDRPPTPDRAAPEPPAPEALAVRAAEPAASPAAPRADPVAPEVVAARVEPLAAPRAPAREPAAAPVRPVQAPS